MARVLHIDDEEAARRLVRKVLEAAGHEVVEAASGIEGIRAERKWQRKWIERRIGEPLG